MLVLVVVFSWEVCLGNICWLGGGVLLVRVVFYAWENLTW